MSSTGSSAKVSAVSSRAARPIPISAALHPAGLRALSADPYRVQTIAHTGRVRPMSPRAASVLAAVLSAAALAGCASADKHNTQTTATQSTTGSSNMAGMDMTGGSGVATEDPVGQWHQAGRLTGPRDRRLAGHEDPGANDDADHLRRLQRQRTSRCSSRPRSELPPDDHAQRRSTPA